jgi:hypothetical protein
MKEEKTTGQRDTYSQIAAQQPSDTVGALITGVFDYLGFNELPEKMRNFASGQIGDFAVGNVNLFAAEATKENIEALAKKETKFFETQPFHVRFLAKYLSKEDRVEIMLAKQKELKGQKGELHSTMTNIAAKKMPPKPVEYFAKSMGLNHMEEID